MKNKWEQLGEKGRKRAVGISKAAARLFHKKSYLETSMGDISAAARMSKGGVYHYFSSKDEILFFILNNFMSIMVGDLEQELQEIEGASSRLEFIISRHIEIYTKNLSESKTLLHEANCLPLRYFNIIAEKERKYYRIVAEVLSEFLGKPVKKDKLTGISFILFGMCNWIYHWYDPRGSLTPKDLSGMMFEIFLNGVKTL